MALLVLDRPLTKSESVGTVCLPEKNERINPANCLATGWGTGNFGNFGIRVFIISILKLLGNKESYAVVLKKVPLKLIGHRQCQKALRATRLGKEFVLHPKFTCAGGEKILGFMAIILTVGAFLIQKDVKTARFGQVRTTTLKYLKTEFKGLQFQFFWRF